MILRALFGAIVLVVGMIGMLLVNLGVFLFSIVLAVLGFVAPIVTAIIAFPLVLFGLVSGSDGTKKMGSGDLERKLLGMVEQGRGKSPSWLDDPGVAQRFKEKLMAAATSAGMTQSRARNWFLQPNTAALIMTAAACAEEEGYGLDEQISFACNVAKGVARKQLEHDAR